MNITSLVILDSILQRVTERSQDFGLEPGNVNFDGDSIHVSSHVEQRGALPELELLAANTDLIVRVDGPGHYEVKGTWDGQTVRGITTPQKDHLQVGADLIDMHPVSGGTQGTVTVGGKTQTFAEQFCRDSQTTDYLVAGQPVAQIRAIPQGTEGVSYVGTVKGQPFSFTERKTLA